MGNGVSREGGVSGERGRTDKGIRDCRRAIRLPPSLQRRLLLLLLLLSYNWVSFRGRA